MKSVFFNPRNLRSLDSFSLTVSSRDGYVAPRWMTIGLVFALSLIGSSRGSPQELSWASSVETGTELLAAGELDAAVRELRLAVLFHPLHRPARASLDRARRALYAKLLAEARRFLRNKSIRQAVPRLQRAAELELRAQEREEAFRLLRNLGYEVYEDSWHHQEDIVALEKRALRLARNRREDLELPERFALHRRARLRLFTDLKFASDAVRLQRLFERLQGAVKAYRELFLPFDLDEDWQGLDIVIMERPDEYARTTASSKTAGLFLPARRASYFCFGSAAAVDEPAAIRVIFHEICHQLDYKLLRMTHPPPWLQEGLALYFEGLRPGPEGGYAFEGLPSDTWRHLSEGCLPGARRWLGLERLIATQELGPLHGTPQIHDFYAQAALLVHFFLSLEETRPRATVRRALFYSLIAVARKDAAMPATAVEDFRHVLAETGWTLKEFEKNYVNALREMSQ